MNYPSNYYDQQNGYYSDHNSQYNQNHDYSYGHEDEGDDMIRPFDKNNDPYLNTRIIVAVRKRPINAKELAKDDQDIIRVNDSTVSVIEKKKTVALK